MDKKALPIYAVSGLEYAPDEAPDFKTLVKEVFGKQIRRIGPFIQMALIGAADVMRHSPLPTSTNVYFTSGSGDMGVTIDVLHRTVRDRQIPKPLSFINTVSNAACYYLTKHFSVGGSTTFLSTREFALESVLQQAQTDIEIFDIETAIVGSVDILTAPEDVHRRRIGVKQNARLAQGTHWFRLEKNASQDSPLGYLVDVGFHKNLFELEKIIKNQLTSDTLLAFGDRASAETMSQIQALFKQDLYTHKVPGKGHYGTSAGHTFRDYLNRPDLADSQLLFIQENERGELSSVLLAKD